MIDTTTKFMSARVIDSEQSEEFIRGLERGWVRHFGPQPFYRLTTTEDGARTSQEPGQTIMASNWKSLQDKRTPDSA